MAQAHRSMQLHGSTVVGVLLLSFAAGAVPVAAEDPAGQYAAWIGKPAPEFTLTDLNGDTRSLADSRGKLVVIHFGTSW